MLTLDENVEDGLIPYNLAVRTSKASKKMLLVLAVLAAVVALPHGTTAADTSRLVTEQCGNVPQHDWTESIDAYLRKIPNTMTLTAAPERTWVVGFKTTAPKLQNLNSLWRYKPYDTYCVANETIIEAVVFARDPLHITTDWMSCTGDSGKLGTKVSVSKMRVHFKVDATHEDQPRLVLQKIHADSLYDAELYLNGTSEGVRAVVDTLGHLTKPYLEVMWRKFLREEAPAIVLQHVVIETNRRFQSYPDQWPGVEEMNPMGGVHVIRIG